MRRRAQQRRCTPRSRTCRVCARLAGIDPRQSRLRPARVSELWRQPRLVHRHSRQGDGDSWSSTRRTRRTVRSSRTTGPQPGNRSGRTSSSQARRRISKSAFSTSVHGTTVRIWRGSSARSTHRARAGKRSESVCVRAGQRLQHHGSNGLCGIFCEIGSLVQDVFGEGGALSRLVPSGGEGQGGYKQCTVGDSACFGGPYGHGGGGGGGGGAPPPAKAPPPPPPPSWVAAGWQVAVNAALPHPMDALHVVGDGIVGPVARLGTAVLPSLVGRMVGVPVPIDWRTVAAVGIETVWEWSEHVLPVARRKKSWRPRWRRAALPQRRAPCEDPRAARRSCRPLERVKSYEARSRRRCSRGTEPRLPVH